MTYATINATGRANLIAWLRDVLKEPDHAEKHADVLIQDCDGSWPEERDIYVEVRGFHTRTGNPVTYSFGEHELTFHESDDED